MSDRLSELQRQRALIQGHLAWLDQEIAAALGKPPKPVIAPTAMVKPDTTATVEAGAVDEPIADELIAKFGAESKNTAESVRKGCFVFFALAMVLLLAGIYGLYRYSRNLHAHDVPPPAKSAQDSPENR